jgi:hypothetical protein
MGKKCLKENISFLPEILKTITNDDGRDILNVLNHRKQRELRPSALLRN